ncbi:MAG: 16S rRNA (uracil(1498)-N(3))-methyltransferase [Verrucomicrobia bacterium]|nr:MAG: 16S rRNA (uracil(1498)-N(3))-methyltransferase [Verrucomicrobiota bacterium]
MPDFRVFIAHTPSLEPAEIALSLAESHHLINVNRASVGAPVIAFDGSGTEWSCRLARVDGRKTAVLQIFSTQKCSPLPCALVLGQALPKGGTMEDIVRQATELGAAVIVPLASARSELHLDPERAEKKLEKWRAGAIEAAKQCGNPWVPKIEPVSALKTFLASPAVRNAELRVIASLQPGAHSVRSILADFRAAHGGRCPRSVAWLVGPEGDFAPEEVAAALASEWRPVTLGPLVLRCDTAAAYALAVLRCETDALA